MTDNDVFSQQIANAHREVVLRWKLYFWSVLVFIFVAGFILWRWSVAAYTTPCTACFDNISTSCVGDLNDKAVCRQQGEKIAEKCLQICKENPTLEDH